MKSAVGFFSFEKMEREYARGSMDLAEEPVKEV